MTIIRGKMLTNAEVVESKLNTSVAGDGIQGGAVAPLGVDVSDFAGTGLEDDGAENLRIASTAAGNGLQGGSGVALSVKPDATGGANLAKSINVSGNGVAVKIDDVTIKEEIGTSRIYVYKLFGNWTQVDSFSPTPLQNYADCDTAIDLAAGSNNTPRTNFTGNPGVFVDAQGNYVGGTALPMPAQVIGYGRPGMVIIRDATSNDPLIDATGNEIYGVLFYDTSVSKFYVRWFSDPAGVQTAYTMGAAPGNIDFIFPEIDTFTNIPPTALLNMPGNFLDLVTGDITGVVAGDGLQGGGTSGTVTVDIDVSDFAGNGLEDDGSENLRVKADVTTGGDVAAVSVGGNGVGLNVSNLDGDHLDIDWNPTNYTPAATPPEAADADDLTAHLYGIDQSLGTKISTVPTGNKWTASAATVGNYQTTGVLIAATPKGYVEVMVNGIAYELGNAVRTKACYFSSDGGTTARAWANIVSGDTLYWNGLIALHNLAVTDYITLNYL